MPHGLISKLAEATIGFSGSDIQAVCTEAVLCCLKRSYPSVNCPQELRSVEINFEALKVRFFYLFRKLFT